jgi:hypothetical protein
LDSYTRVKIVSERGAHQMNPSSWWVCCYRLVNPHARTRICAGGLAESWSVFGSWSLWTGCRYHSTATSATWPVLSSWLTGCCLGTHPPHTYPTLSSLTHYSSNMWSTMTAHHSFLSLCYSCPQSIAPPAREPQPDPGTNERPYYVASWWTGMTSGRRGHRNIGLS